MKRRRSLSVAIAGSSLFMASAVFAEPSAAEIAAGRKLFKEAVELEEGGNWAQAAEKLQSAIAVKDTPGLRFHLARCQEEQGNLVEALEEYERVDELIRSGAEATDVVPLLGPSRAAVEARIPKLRLILPADVASPSIEIDGTPIPPPIATQPMPLNPRRYRIVVRAAGRRPFERDIVLEPGNRADVDVALAHDSHAAPAPAPPKPAPALVAGVDMAESPSNTSARTLVLASEAGFTVVSLGVGVAFAFMHSSASDRVFAGQTAVDRSSGGDRGACASPMPVAPESCAELASAVSDRDQSEALMYVGFVGAGVGALATAATWLLWPAEPPKQRSWRVDLTLARAGTVLGVGGAF